MIETPFSGKVALVTGSSRGIGFATARELGHRGATVVLNARGQDRLGKAREALAGEGLAVAAIRADVASPEACGELIAEIVRRFGGLDILVNNAGLMMSARYETIGPEVYKRIVDVNLLGGIYATHFALPHLKERGGSVVFVSSIAGLVGLPSMSIYCATKQALTGLAGSLRCELAPDGVHVGVVYAGFTENDPEKTMIGPGGTSIQPRRPPYHSQADVAVKIVALVRRRRRQVVLTPYGKLVHLLMRVSPGWVEKALALIEHRGLRGRLGVE
jgi:NAD(P)-dependent dehydrogenase (short-subunit alcohol dehydrogenase family)